MDEQATAEANTNHSGELFGSSKPERDRQGGTETAARVHATTASHRSLLVHDHPVDLVELYVSLCLHVRLPNVQPVLGGRGGEQAVLLLDSVRPKPHLRHRAHLHRTASETL